MATSLEADTIIILIIIIIVTTTTTTTTQRTRLAKAFNGNFYESKKVRFIISFHPVIIIDT